MSLNNASNDNTVVQLHNDADNNSDSNQPQICSDLTPHPEPVGAEIFDEIVSDLQTYLFISEENAIKATYWVAHANLFREFEYTPRLVITAPVKNCGKTVLLSVLQAMTNHSLNGDNMTPACYFRISSGGDVSFFLDEADEWFRKGNDKNRDLVAALNGGNKQRGCFYRTVGDSHTPRAFPTHAAVALSGIQLDRQLADTTLDRSILIFMQRAKPGQLNERFRSRTHLPIFKKHGERLLRWCNEHRERLKSHLPKIPDHVDGREYDNWEAMISIAELASANWGRKMLDILLNQTPMIGDDVLIRFLQDCRRIYDMDFSGDKMITGQDLALTLARLPDEEENNWFPYSRFNANKFKEEQDSRIKVRQITALLKPCEVGRKTIWVPELSRRVKGFMWSELLNAQETYAAMPNDYDSGYVPGENREESVTQWVADYDKHSEGNSNELPY